MSDGQDGVGPFPPGEGGWTIEVKLLEAIMKAAAKAYWPGPNCLEDVEAVLLAAQQLHPEWFRRTPTPAQRAGSEAPQAAMRQAWEIAAKWHDDQSLKCAGRGYGYSQAFPDQREVFIQDFIQAEWHRQAAAAIRALPSPTPPERQP